jgi:hypothetical protein
MQAQKAFDSPRRANRGAVADLRDRLNYNWPKEGTALPPRHEIILTPLTATYKVCSSDFSPDILAFSAACLAPEGSFSAIQTFTTGR